MQHKILIVEDEEIIRLGLQDNFELENYIVETAADGEEAIAKADSFLPHLVILDLMIPKKSGFEVCRVIRKKHPECFIIMLTAKTEETAIAQLIRNIHSPTITDVHVHQGGGEAWNEILV